MDTKKNWMRLLAALVVVPLAVGCAEEGTEMDVDEVETPAPTTDMERVELEPIGTATTGSVDGWVESRTEEDELVLTLNLEHPGMGTTTGREAEDIGDHAGMDMDWNARLVRGMCMDLESRPAAPTGETETDTETEADLETIADFEEPADDGMGETGMPGMRSGESDTQAGMGSFILEARVDLDDIEPTDSYAVVVDGSDEENPVACADVTQLVQNRGATTPGTPNPAEPTGEGEGSEGY